MDTGGLITVQPSACNITGLGSIMETSLALLYLNTVFMKGHKVHSLKFSQTHATLRQAESTGWLGAVAYTGGSLQTVLDMGGSLARRVRELSEGVITLQAEKHALIASL